MTLAETASIFCETIVVGAALQGADRESELNIIESSIQRALSVCVDISSRFLFEKEVFSRTKEQNLTARELCEVMLWSQEETYGDGLSAERHAYMWAVKPHYYSSRGFYNFPYMFGQLFSLGLYELYRNDPEKFVGMYDDLLSSTGLADAATLAAGFGININESAFWEGSLRIVETQIDRFVELAASK
jgi:oligoendopeptidase F